MRRFRIFAMAAPGLLLALLLITSSAAGGKGADVRSQKFAFTTTNLLPQTGGFGEPSIALTSKDHVFMCGPLGLTTGNAVVRSPDWKTFQRFNIKDQPWFGNPLPTKQFDDGSSETKRPEKAGSASCSIRFFPSNQH